jgi:hypothetical protein
VHPCVACAVRAPQRRTHFPEMADGICQNGDDTWPLLKELTRDQEREVTWQVGRKVAEALWDLHAEAHWTPNVDLPTGKDEDELVKKTSAHVLKTLENDEILHVRDLGYDGDGARHDAVAIDRMHSFFKAVLRIGHSAVQLYILWPSKRDTLPSAQCDETPDAPPFDFPGVLEASLQLHFKSVIERAVQKALKNKDEPLRHILEAPPFENDDEEEESVDEGSDIGDDSNSEEEEESESDSEDEEEPPSKKKK